MLFDRIIFVWNVKNALLVIFFHIRDERSGLSKFDLTDRTGKRKFENFLSRELAIPQFDNLRNNLFTILLLSD